MSLADRLKEMLGAKQAPAVKRPTTPLAELLAKGKASARPSVQADVVGEATRALVAAGRFEAPAEDHKPLVTLLQPKVVGPSLFAGISKAGPKTRKKSVEKQENVKKLSLRLLQEMGKDPEDYAKNSKIGAAFRVNGVSESSELDRVHRLPRRSADLNQYEDLSPVYARPGSNWKLWPVQNAILHEAKKANGLLGPVGVGHGKCVLGDTEIYDVSSGRRRRVDEPGSFVVATMREPGEVTASEASAFPSGRKPCVEVRLDGGSKIGLSTDHPVYTSNGWVRASELKSGMFVGTPRNLPQPRQSPVISDDELRFIAYMMADGGCTGTAPIFTKMEPDIVQAFIEVVTRLGGKVVDRPSQSRARELTIKGLDHLVNRYGLRILSKNKRVPDSFYGLTDHQAALFLNLFIACDGHVDTRVNLIDVVLASEGLIDDIRFLLLRLGITSRKSYKLAKCQDKQFDAWRLIVSGKSNVSLFFNKVGILKGREDRCRQVVDALNVVHGNTNVDIVPISRPEFAEICDEMGWHGRGGVRTIGAGRPRSQAREFLGCTAGQYVGREKFAAFCLKYNYSGSYSWLATSDLFWDRVKSVSDIGEHDVFDLSVPETKSFVANGIVVHNTISSLLVGKHMDAKRIVLLVPPQLRVQLIQQDIPRLNKEFYLPLERLSVVAYSELSSAKSADILEQLNPDLIVADECHNLRHRSAARSKRFARFMKEHPECRFVGLSGTITRRSLKDFGHLAEYALRGRSPLPHNYHTLNEWAEALDVGKDPLAAGELKRFCNDEELAVINSSLSPLDAQPAVRSAFRRRLVETPGVVSTEEGAIGTSLVLRALKPRVPAEVQIALQALRNTWCVGEDELVDILSVIRAGCQISGGFFYRWLWPDGQKDMEWLEARKMWHQELREILKLSRRGLDSPLLVENAIRRGELESAAHEQWEAVRGRFNPTPPREAVWIDDFLVKESVQWAKENCSKASPGIIWYSWQELGEKIAAMGGFPFIGGGADAELAAIDVKKTPVIVASQKAHGTGKNLQAFCQNLFTTPMGGGVDWEQTLARTHRPGQLADEVNGDVFVHTFEMERSWLSAMKDARYIEDSQGQKQKLLYAEKIGFPEDE